MKRQQAFEGAGKMLKGGLHCHTTRSDGKGTPEEVISLHYKNGYDFLALTDHNVYNLKDFAPELPITIIPGTEICNDIEAGRGFRTFHVVCIGPKKEDGNGYEQDQRFPIGYVKNQYEFQPTLDEVHANKNLTIYCHPQWSSTPARYFEDQKGHFAMEIWNSGSAIWDDMDRDAAYWDEILGQGKVIYGVATDDGHQMSDHCNGWVMVNAKNDVNSILEALSEGKFYSSCGPEIYDFYMEDGKAVVECSPACKVRFHSDMHPNFVRFAEKGKTITRAEADLKNYYNFVKYVRAVVIDEKGRYAWTNPIFVD